MPALEKQVQPHSEVEEGELTTPERLVILFSRNFMDFSEIFETLEKKSGQLKFQIKELTDRSEDKSSMHPTATSRIGIVPGELGKQITNRCE